MAEDKFTLVAKWKGKEYPVTLDKENTTIKDLKLALQAETNVLPERQKFIGVIKGKLPADETLLSTLSINDGKKFTMMGTAEDNIAKHPSEVTDVPEVVDDLDWDYDTKTSDISRKPQYLHELKKTTEKTEIHVLNAPRPGKKLLVLDLDYTLFDMKSPGNSIEDLKRPYMDDFLAECYQNYDLVIWSQTAWHWLEAKLTELGILTSYRYKISFVLDITSMFYVNSLVKGQEKKHQVKALGIIWNKFPEFYNEKNTLHIDDLARNFAMNPRNGIRCTAFRNAPTMRNDKELFYLARYLKLVKDSEDVRELDLDKWMELLDEHGQGSSSS